MGNGLGKCLRTYACCVAIYGWKQAPDYTQPKSFPGVTVDLGMAQLVAMNCEASGRWKEAVDALETVNLSGKVGWLVADRCSNFINLLRTKANTIGCDDSVNRFR